MLSNAFTTEVHTWGTNQNYTLGFGVDSGKGSPEYLEFFEKKNEIIIDVIIPLSLSFRLLRLGLENIISIEKMKFLDHLEAGFPSMNVFILFLCSL